MAAVPYAGRGLPVAWTTSRKGLYTRSRNKLETTFCYLLKSLLPEGIELVIVADRGFGRASFFRALRHAGIRFIVRIRRDVHLIDERGSGPVHNRTIQRGQTRDLPDALYGDDARLPVRCVPTYRFVKRYLQRRTPLPLSLKQVDPLIRQLTEYRDLIDRITTRKETP